jgi:L-asparaginase
MVWNMSLESAYVKLVLAYGNYIDNHSITQFLEKNIAFEIISS